MINLRKNILKALSEQLPFDNRKSWGEFSEELRHFLLYGDSQQEFVLKWRLVEVRLKTGFSRYLKRPGKYDENHLE